MTNQPHSPSTVDLDAISYDEISEPAVMNKNPLVSVLMITFNHRPYIAEAIEGVLMQKTDFPIELVIGEDCSTDGTREIVLEYQKQHPDAIRVITSERNVGASPNELRTFKACRGKYIAFCEGDDYWHHPHKLQKQVDILEEDLDVGLVHTGVDRYYVKTGRRVPWSATPRKTGGYDTFTNILLDMHPTIYTCTACMRRSQLVSVYQDNPDSFSDEFINTDTQTFLEICRISKVRLIDESLATYNVLPESAWQTDDRHKKIQRLRAAYRMQLHFVRKYSLPAEVEMRIRRGHNSLLLALAFSAEDKIVAQEASQEMRNTPGGLAPKQWLMLLGTVHPWFGRLIRMCGSGRQLLKSAIFGDSISG